MHTVETGLTLLHHASLPLKFWSYAFSAAAYLINRMPNKNLNFHTPYETLFGQKPNYHRLKVFGCLCYPWLKPYAPSKLHPRSVPCLFLGYSSSQSAYKCLDVATNRVYISRHVRFIENQFPFKDKLKLPSQLPASVDSTSGTSRTSNSDYNSYHSNVGSLYTPSQLYTNNDKNQSEPSSSILSTPDHPSPPSSPMSTSTHHQISITSPPATIDNNPPETSLPLRPPRQRHPNPKYYNKSFVNHTTVHPLPSSIEPSSVTQALKDPHWRDAMAS